MAAGLFRREPKVNEEAGGRAIMSYEIAHQDIHNIIVEAQHRCINYQYSNE
jgi:hypothetical protein